MALLQFYIYVYTYTPERTRNIFNGSSIGLPFNKRTHVLLFAFRTTIDRLTLHAHLQEQNNVQLCDWPQPLEDLQIRAWATEWPLTSTYILIFSWHQYSCLSMVGVSTPASSAIPLITTRPAGTSSVMSVQSDGAGGLGSGFRIRLLKIPNTPANLSRAPSFV